MTRSDSDDDDYRHSRRSSRRERSRGKKNKRVENRALSSPSTSSPIRTHPRRTPFLDITAVEDDTNGDNKDDSHVHSSELTMSPEYLMARISELESQIQRLSLANTQRRSIREHHRESRYGRRASSTRIYKEKRRRSKKSAGRSDWKGTVRFNRETLRMEFIEMNLGDTKEEDNDESEESTHSDDGSYGDDDDNDDDSSYEQDDDSSDDSEDEEGDSSTKTIYNEKNLNKLVSFLLRDDPSFENITQLDVSRSNITSVKRGAFVKLRNLTELNLSYNKIRSASAILDAVSQVHSLRFLKLKNSGPRLFERDASSYAPNIFRRMRLLQTLDGEINRHPLIGTQLEAVDYLYVEYGISGNDLMYFDFTDQNLDKDQFWPIILALNALVTEIEYESSDTENQEHSDDVSDLERGVPSKRLLDPDMLIGPKGLYLRDGNFSQEAILDYFFIVVNHIPTLTMLDGVKVTERNKTSVLRRAMRLERNIAQQVPKEEDFKLVPVQRLTLEFVRTETFNWLQSCGQQQEQQLTFDDVLNGDIEMQDMIEIRITPPEEPTVEETAEREEEEDGRNDEGGIIPNDRLSRIILNRPKLNKSRRPSRRRRIGDLFKELENLEDDHSLDPPSIRSERSDHGSARDDDEDGNPTGSTLSDDSVEASRDVEDIEDVELFHDSETENLQSHSSSEDDDFFLAEGEEQTEENRNIEEEEEEIFDVVIVETAADKEQEGNESEIGIDVEEEEEEDNAENVQGDGPDLMREITLTEKPGNAVEFDMNIADEPSDNDSSSSHRMPAIEAASARDITLSFIEQNWKSMPVFGLYEEQVHHLSSSQMMALGSILEKIELAIVTIQIFSLIVNFNVQWPDLFRTAGDYLGLSILDIENILPDIGYSYSYLKYFLIMFIPAVVIIMFTLPYNRNRWDTVFGELFLVPMLGVVILWVLGMILSVVAAFSMDIAFLEMFLRAEPLPLSFFWTMISLMAAVTIVCLILFLSVLAYRINRNNHNFLRLFFVAYRRFFLLFILSITYTPIMYTLLSSYLCDETGKTLKLYTDQTCPDLSTWSNVPPMYYISSVLFIIYAVAVPLIFVVLIWQGYSAMARKFRFKEAYAKLRELEKEEKEARNKLREVEPQSILPRMKRRDIVEKLIVDAELEKDERYGNKRTSASEQATYCVQVPRPNDLDSGSDSTVDHHNDEGDDDDDDGHEGDDSDEDDSTDTLKPLSPNEVKFAKVAARAHRQKHYTKTMYNKALKETTTTSSFLFSPFESMARFTKPLLLLESVLIAMIGTFLHSFPVAQIPVAGAIILMYLLYGIVTRPYLDSAQDALFMFVHLSLLLQCLLGYALVWRNNLGIQAEVVDIIASAGLYIILGLQLMFTISVLLSYGVRKLIDRILRAYNARKITADELKKQEEHKRQHQEDER